MCFHCERSGLLLMNWLQGYDAEIGWNSAVLLAPWCTRSQAGLSFLIQTHKITLKSTSDLHLSTSADSLSDPTLPCPQVKRFGTRMKGWLLILVDFSSGRYLWQQYRKAELSKVHHMQAVTGQLQ